MLDSNKQLKHPCMFGKEVKLPNNWLCPPISTSKPNSQKVLITKIDLENQAFIFIKLCTKFHEELQVSHREAPLLEG